MERIDLRRGSEDGPDVRVGVDAGRSRVAIDVTIDGARTEHAVPRARIEGIVRRLEDAVVPAVALDPTPAIATGYELVVTTGMSQSVFRWVGATPAGWEPLQEAAHDLLRLARELTGVVAVAP